MVGTFPAVWLFQIVIAPFAFCILLLAGMMRWFLEPSLPATTENPVVIRIFIAAVLVDVALVLAASVLGFYEGWRAGWRCAMGRSWREAIGDGPSMRLIRLARMRLRERGSS
jgi:hypothetical protein